MADVPKGAVPPVMLAKRLGVRPQIIYSLIRRGKVRSWRGGRSELVDPDEVEKILSSPGKPGRPKSEESRDEEGGIKPPVKKGDIVSWGTRTGKRIAQVKYPDNLLVQLRDIKNREAIFMTTSMKKLIANGTIKIEDPVELIRMIITQWKLQDHHSAAESLEDWLGQYLKGVDDEVVVTV